MDLNLGSRLRTRFVAAGSSNYDAGNTTTIKLPKGFLWRTLWLRLVGTANITTAGTVLAEAPLQLIQKLELVADGGRTIFSNAAREFYRLANFQTGFASELVPPSGTGASVAFAAFFPITFEAWKRLNPADSLFYSEPFTELELKITWASSYNLATGATATVNATTKLESYLEDTTEGHDQAKLLRQVTYVEKTVTAAQTEFEMPLPKSGLLDFCMIHCDVDGTPNDALINTIRFQFDNSFEPLKNIPWVVLQNKGCTENDVQGGSATTGRVAGYAFWDPIENGLISSAPNLKAMTDPKLILDVALPSGTTRTIRVTLVTYDVSPFAQAAA